MFYVPDDGVDTNPGGRVPVTPAGPAGPGGGDPTAAIRASLNLVSNDYGSTLIITFKVQVWGGPLPPKFSIFYLSPLDVSEDQISSTPRQILVFGQFVTDISVSSPNRAVTMTLPALEYTPVGSEGTRRDYSLGGWMYVIPTEVTVVAEADFYDYVSPFAPVPTFPTDTSPIATTEYIYSLLVTTVGPDSFGIYTVNVAIRSPYPQVIRTRFVEIWMYNYRGLGLYENLGLVSISTVPKSQKVISFRLEKDGGGHNVTFYAAECNFAKSRRFGKDLGTYFGAGIGTLP